MKSYEEKREVLLKRFKFPCRAIMYLKKEKQGFTILLSDFRGKKKKLENVRFEEIQAFTLDGLPMTPIYVGDFENADDLLTAFEVEGDKWIDKGAQE